MVEFHVSRQARDTYQFENRIFSFTGNVIITDFQAARRFAQRMNAVRDAVNHPERAVKASEINAMGLIDETLHLLVARYRQQVNPQLWQEVQAQLKADLGEEKLEDALRAFLVDFPPVDVYQQKLDIESYLQGETNGLKHRDITLEEMLMLWLANANPAFSPFLELFDDGRLEQHTAYPEIIKDLERILRSTPAFGPGGESLFDLLRAPALAAPHSLEGQLRYIRSHWAHLLGPELLRLLRSLDFIAEENKPLFGGPGPVVVTTYGEEDAPEQYSPDQDWMPRLVLLAKNTYVWLDQLSKQYGYPITRLDQIPDEELATLARRGISGLWLIGLWERSRASQRIKQMMGNPEAVASAYSLYDYIIANELGGPEALENLKRRAWRYGIRMASDMVPNHMAIDSRWVIEHPERFLSLDSSPFPSYTFNGPDLCDDERVGVYIEDHYYDHTDAAVVFKRIDYWTGDTRYIYHGNDGTSMPWNDTAQLNYLDTNVREVVIQTILNVARQFPIIRFDAAMTLAKRHIQRLWFPEPGSGGDIPSRAEHGLTKEEFDALMPNEFWREVVDRVAVEAPDTLLLAEAFWLMEGYFVRTLGMHRVYNSAFMHMLRDEDNDKYRQLIKNTLEFDPEILKRYVNFMSNPDEETAVNQFGKGDKYFGVCTVLATIPGLPMFGHGQFEGYTEKYGMEYRRAYYDEQPDLWLIDRHMREIVPLLKRRHLFAEVQNFLLFDLYTASAVVDENVLAYSNRRGEERSLVFYHNKYADTRGWIRLSAAYIDKEVPGESKPLVQKSLAQGLDIPDDPNSYVIFREVSSRLEYIRNCRQLHEEGLYVQLGPYQKLVFLDFRIVHDDESRLYQRLTAQLQGNGTPDIDKALKRLYLQPLHQAFRAVINANTLAWLQTQRQILGKQKGKKAEKETSEQQQRWRQIETSMLALLQETQLFAHPKTLSIPPEHSLDTGILQRRLVALETGIDEPEAEPVPAEPPAPTTSPDLPLFAARTQGELRALVSLATTPAEHKWQRKFNAYLQSWLDDPLSWALSVSWVVSRWLAPLASEGEVRNAQEGAWLERWLFDEVLAAEWQAFGVEPVQIGQGLTLLKALLLHPQWYEEGAKGRVSESEQQGGRSYRVLQALLKDNLVRQALGVNEYDGVWWYREEAMSYFLGGLLTVGAVRLLGEPALSPRKVNKRLRKIYRVIRKIQKADRRSQYHLERLLRECR